MSKAAHPLSAFPFAGTIIAPPVLRLGYDNHYLEGTAGAKGVNLICKKQAPRVAEGRRLYSKL